MSSMRLALKQSLLEGGLQSSSSSERKRKKGKKRRMKTKLITLNSCSGEDGNSDEVRPTRKKLETFNDATANCTERDNDDTSEENEFVAPNESENDEEDDDDESDSGEDSEESTDSKEQQRDTAVRNRRRNNLDDEDDDRMGGSGRRKGFHRGKEDDENGNDSCTSAEYRKQRIHQDYRRNRKSPIPSSVNKQSPNEQHSAANMIQNRWKRKQERKNRDKDDDEEDEYENDFKERCQFSVLPKNDFMSDDKELDNNHKSRQKGSKIISRKEDEVAFVHDIVRRKKQKQPGSKNESLAKKIVAPPDPSIVEWMQKLPIKECRRSIKFGMRVKVPFDTKVVVKRRERSPDGTEHVTKEIAQKKKWFGGRVVRMSKEGSKIRIKYDDGTKEETKFPDGDVVVDDTDNGDHHVRSDEVHFIDVFKPQQPPEAEELLAPQSPPLDTKSTKMILSLTRTGNSEVYSNSNQPMDVSDLVDTPLQQATISNACSSSNAPQIALHTEVCMHERTEIVQQLSTTIHSYSDHSRRSASSPLMSSRSSPSRMTTPPPLPRSPVFDKEFDHEDRINDIQYGVDTEPSNDVNACLLKLPSTEPVHRDSDSPHRNQQVELSADVVLATSCEYPLGAGCNPASKPASPSLTIDEGVAEKTLPADFCHNSDSSVLNDAAPLLNDESGDVHSRQELSNRKRNRSSLYDIEERSELRSGYNTQHTVSLLSTSDGDAGVGDPTLFSSIEKGAVQELIILPQFKIRLPALIMDTDGRSPRSLKKVSSNETKKIQKKKKSRGDESQPSDPVAESTEGEPQLPTATEPCSKDKCENSYLAHALDQISPTCAPKRKVLVDSESVRSSNSPKGSPHQRKKRKKVVNTAVEEATSESQPICKMDMATYEQLIPPVEVDASHILPKFVRLKTAQADIAPLTIEGKFSETEVKLDDVAAVSSVDHEDKVMLLNEGKKMNEENVGAIRSGRRAAQQANERISSNTTDPNVGKKKKKIKDETEKKSENVSGTATNSSISEEFRWVLCDKCGKWRVIPSNVVDSLPEKWFCSDNIYDLKRSTCDAPQQTEKEFTKERKRKLKKQQRMLLQHTTDALNPNELEHVPPRPSGNAHKNDDLVAVVSTLSSEPEPGVDSTTILAKKETIDDHCTLIVQSIENELPQNSVSKSKRQADTESNDVATAADEMTEGQSNSIVNNPKHERRMSAIGKKIKQSSGDTQLVESAYKQNQSAFDAGEVRRGRGRPRRNPGKDINNSSGGIVGLNGHKVEDDNVEWVLCEKCGKWRRLPSHISTDDLPEQWYCELNTWSPECASCDVPEDKADGMQDIGCIGGTGGLGIGKLTYRNLIFGSTGRKLNKIVTEKARAAESLFSIHYDEDSAPSKVLYADSSAFLGRNRPSLFSGDDSENRISVLELMSHTALWSDLRNAAISRGSDNCTFLGQYERATRLASYTFETLPVDARNPMKQMILFHLSDDRNSVMSGEELFARGKNAALVPCESSEFEIARRYWTINAVVTTVVQLVKEGIVECVRKATSENLYDSFTASTVEHHTPFYRRALSNASKRSTALNESVDEQYNPTGIAFRNKSRFIKIAKPWKLMSATNPFQI